MNSHNALTSRGASLLAELDVLIAELDSTLAEQQTARLTVTDAESEQAVIEASLTLTIEGKNDAERKARLVLALREDAGYQELARVVREARTALLDTDRRLAVIKARMQRARAALALLAHIPEET